MPILATSSNGRMQPERRLREKKQGAGQRLVYADLRPFVDPAKSNAPSPVKWTK